MIMTTGARIKAARKKAGMTQDDLGAKLGVSGSMIAQYETGKRKPKIETLKKIADALKVDTYLDLYGDSDSKDVAAHIKEGIKIGTAMKSGLTREAFLAEYQEYGYIFDSVEKRLVSAFNKLNFNGRTLALITVEGMADIHRFMLEPPEDDEQPPEDNDWPPDGSTQSQAPPEGTDTTPPGEKPSEGG